MPSAIVIGGGLAGMAAAAALGEIGFQVDLFEARPFLGGRAASYPLPGSGDPPEIIDNGQHVLLRCCVNLLDFYQRLGVGSFIRFHRQFYFIEPGGRVSVLRAGRLPAPFHLAASLLRLRCLTLADKFSIVRGLRALKRDWLRQDLGHLTMLDWLSEHRQTPRAIRRFWRPVLVAAVNEDLGRMAASHAFQVMWLSFFPNPDAFEMGVPSVPLGRLYGPEAWARFPSVRIHLRSAVERLVLEGDAVHAVLVGGARHSAGACVCAVPFQRLPALAPELELDFTGWEHSSITTIHLWFDRPVTKLPHATLLDRTIPWFFSRQEGRYLQLVVSASRDLQEMPTPELISLALRELPEFLPPVRQARLEKAHVVKEVHATFSALPGLEARRPPAVTRFPNLFLAGDWTRSGWPSTMEGAVRSGYLAAEAVASAAGIPAGFLLPDLA